MRPFGLISRNQGSFWVFLARSILCALYGRLRELSARHFLLKLIYLPELLQRNGYLDSIWSLSGVEVDVGSFLIVYDSHLGWDMLVELIETVQHILKLSLWLKYRCSENIKKKLDQFVIVKQRLLSNQPYDCVLLKGHTTSLLLVTNVLPAEHEAEESIMTITVT